MRVFDVLRSPQVPIVRLHSACGGQLLFDSGTSHATGTAPTREWSGHMRSRGPMPVWHGTCHVRAEGVLGVGNEGDLYWLLDYELRCAHRYGRYVSVICLDAGTTYRLRQVLSESLRASDEIIELSTTITVLMCDTDESSALSAMTRCCETYAGAGSRFGVASYPKDGRDPATLLAVARRRMEVSKQIGKKDAVL